jgi:glycosyltransferase involved in cell wall biosynthesis
MIFLLNKKFMPQATPKISIILPCYNVEKYLAQALTSAINQTLTDIEIIPVDDGSPDNCKEIIQEFASKDSRIKPIFKKNGGYGSAVNAGIKQATGDYIAILEPDDYVMEEYYNILYQETRHDDLDICGVNAYCEVRNMTHPKLVQTQWIDNPDYMSFDNVNELLGCGNVGITLKIYKRSFLINNNIWLHEDLRAYHDVPFVSEAMDKANKVRIIIGTGYYYRKDDITSTTKSKANFIGITSAIDKVLDYMQASPMRAKRKQAFAGYCLRALLHYFKLMQDRFVSSSAATFIKSKIYDILASNETIAIHASSVKALKELSNHTVNFIAIKKNVLNFSHSPGFHIDYYKEDKAFSSIISKLFFYAYMPLPTQNTQDIVACREMIFGVVWYVPGLKAKPLSDFMQQYLEIALFDFQKNHNERWFITFLWYLKTHIDQKYFAPIIEALNEKRTDTSVMRNYLDITHEFPCNFANIDEAFRKTHIIKQSIINQKIAFERFISGKSIAIVGNAPCEVGQGKGAEIDNHDIVIRFNNYSTAQKHRQDYGKKTTIWAITPGIESLKYQDQFYEYDFVIAPTLGMRLSEDRMNIIYNYIIAGGKYFQCDTIDCRRQSNVMIPSIGLYVLSYLSTLTDIIGPVSLYGFDPLSAKNEKRHYFEGDPVPTSNLTFHDWDSEKTCITEYKKFFLEYSRQKV